MEEADAQEEPPARGPAARPDRPQIRPASYFLVSLLFSVLVLAFFFVSGSGFLQVRRQRRQLAELQAEVTQLDVDNRKLEAEVLALRTDPKAVEKIARERLNLVRPGDVVIVLPDGWESKVRPKAPAPVPLPAR